MWEGSLTLLCPEPPGSKNFHGLMGCHQHTYVPDIDLDNHHVYIFEYSLQMMPVAAKAESIPELGSGGPSSVPKESGITLMSDTTLGTLCPSPTPLYSQFSGQAAYFFTYQGQGAPGIQPHSRHGGEGVLSLCFAHFSECQLLGSGLADNSQLFCHFQSAPTSRCPLSPLLRPGLQLSRHCSIWASVASVWTTAAYCLCFLFSCPHAP